MSEILGGVKATYDYIKHGIDTYNRQQRLRELKDKGGIEAIKQAIQAGEFSGGAKKGLVMEDKKKKKKTVKKSPTVAKRRGRPFGSYQPKPAVAQSAISRGLPYYNLGTVSQQPLPQQLSNPLIQRSGMAVMSQQQYDPSYAYQIQQTLRTIQEQKGAIAKIPEQIKKATEEQLEAYKKRLEAEGFKEEKEPEIEAPDERAILSATRKQAEKTAITELQNIDPRFTDTNLQSFLEATTDLTKKSQSRLTEPSVFSPISKMTPPEATVPRSAERKTQNESGFELGKTRTVVGMKPPPKLTESETFFQEFKPVEKSTVAIGPERKPITQKEQQYLEKKGEMLASTRAKEALKRGFLLNVEEPETFQPVMDIRRLTSKEYREAMEEP